MNKDRKRKKSIRWVLFCYLSLLAVSCSGGGSGGGSVGTVTSHSNEITGLWVGECKDNTMTLSLKDNNDLYLSDFNGGSSFGTYKFENDRLCLNIAKTNGEGCAPPSVREYCSKVAFAAADAAIFSDSALGDTGKPFYKVNTKGPYIWGNYIGYWTGSGTNSEGEAMAVEVSVWPDGTVDHLLDAPGCNRGASDERGKWGRDTYAHTNPGNSQSISVEFNNSDSANSTFSNKIACLSITVEMIKKSPTPIQLY